MQKVIANNRGHQAKSRIIMNTRNQSNRGRTKIFTCVNKSTGEESCGIQYPSGTILIGIDVWRNLDKHDCASWPVYKFRSVEDMTREYTVIKRRPPAYRVLP